MRLQTIQSTQDETIHCCIVYDKRTGAVVHIHQFVGQRSKGSFSKGKRAEMALGFASQFHEKEFLEVLHLEEDVELHPNKTYKIDLSSKALLGENFNINEGLQRALIKSKK